MVQFLAIVVIFNARVSLALLDGEAVAPFLGFTRLHVLFALVNGMDDKFAWATIFIILDAQLHMTSELTLQKDVVPWVVTLYNLV